MHAQKAYELSKKCGAQFLKRHFMWFLEVILIILTTFLKVFWAKKIFILHDIELKNVENV